MRYSEIIDEDISRRGFLGGLLGAAATSALGGQKTTTQPSTTVPSKAQNPGVMVASQSDAKTAPTGLQGQGRVVQKYSPQVLEKYIIDYAKKHLPGNQVAQFVAQCAHETNNFSKFEEVLNYTADTLSKKYSKLFPGDTPVKVVNHPRRDEIIANRLYANRMGNGDYFSGDGYKYRGRGYLQLTGRENYDRMSKLLKIDLVNNPDLASLPEYAAPIAVSYWNTRVANKVNAGNTHAVTKKISGSSKQGIQSRLDKVKQYSKELGQKIMPKKNSKSK